MMTQIQAKVIENVPLAERTFRIRLEAPTIARNIRAGQFLMLRLPGRTDPLLGRPFALYDLAPDYSWIDIVYLVVGKMTSALQEVRTGESLEVWGPLGKPFLSIGDATRLTLVAGGIGQTPFLAYAKELAQCSVEVELLYGVRSARFAAGVDDSRKAGVTVHLSSDDGSIGYHGRVTQLLESHGVRGPLVGCGPEPMLHALAKLAERWNVPCQVSLETPMACGVGACYSCVTPVRKSETEWDYQRVCVDGPAFDACQLVWPD